MQQYQNPVRLSAKYKGPKSAGLLLYLRSSCILVHIMYIANNTSNARTVGKTCGSDCNMTNIPIWTASCTGSLKFSWFLGTRIWFGVKDSYRSSVMTMRGKSQSAGFLPAVYVGRLCRRAQISSIFIVPIATVLSACSRHTPAAGVTHSRSSANILPANTI